MFQSNRKFIVNLVLLCMKDQVGFDVENFGAKLAGECVSFLMSIFNVPCQAVGGA